MAFLVAAMSDPQLACVPDATARAGATFDNVVLRQLCSVVAACELCNARALRDMSYAIVDTTCADICVARRRLPGVGHQERSYGSWYN